MWGQDVLPAEARVRLVHLWRATPSSLTLTLPQAKTAKYEQKNLIFDCSASTLKSLIKRPNNRVASKHMPKSLSQHFGRRVCVIEGTEIFIAMLANTTQQFTATQLSTLAGKSGCFFSGSEKPPRISLWCPGVSAVCGVDYSWGWVGLVTLEDLQAHKWTLSQCLFFFSASRNSSFKGDLGKFLRAPLGFYREDVGKRGLRRIVLENDGRLKIYEIQCSQWFDVV